MRILCRLIGHKWQLDRFSWLAVCERCERTESLSGWHRMAVERLIERSTEGAR